MTVSAKQKKVTDKASKKSDKQIAQIKKVIRRYKRLRNDLAEDLDYTSKHPKKRKALPPDMVGIATKLLAEANESIKMLEAQIESD
jgi:hypothetical protein